MEAQRRSQAVCRENASKTPFWVRQFKQLCAAVVDGQSVLVLGKDTAPLATALHEEFVGVRSSAIATYSGNGENFFGAIALGLGLTDPDFSPDEILANCTSDTLLIITEAQRLTTQLCYWLEDVIGEGVTVACFASSHPRKGIFNRMLLVELEPSSKKQRPMRRRHQITKHRTKIAGWIVLTGLGLLLLFGGAIYQTLFPLSPIEIYNKKAATHYIYVDIEGVLPDGSSADGRYLVIGVEDDELIVMDERQRVYQTGQQIFSSKVTTDVGRQLQTMFETLKFNDENAVLRLRQLAASKPNAALIISGTLSVDLPEDLRIFDDPDQYPVATVNGSNIEFSYCPIERAIALLNNQYAIGTVTAKILQPKPQFIQ